MRSLLAVLCALFLPARGKHRATPTPAVRRFHRSLPTPKAPRPADVIEADRLPLVRPYLGGFEWQQEGERQRDRRAAAALSTMGVDFLGVPA
ncbi:hypothetical protein [Streptomyces sp. C10-9-1]|uniref:hypothetical protein n=1 Tax=Streptomyces sp. C10-9-1 TaxID=1859285 RepID=UPI003D754285